MEEIEGGGNTIGEDANTIRWMLAESTWRDDFNEDRNVYRISSLNELICKENKEKVNCN